MDWNSTMTLINGGDTLLGLAILALGARYLARRWRRRRRGRGETQRETQEKVLSPPETVSYDLMKHRNYHIRLNFGPVAGCPYCPQPSSPTSPSATEPAEETQRG